MLFILRSSGLILVAALLCSCVSDSAYQSGKADSAALPVGAASENDYVLSHVEFDDQGWFHDTRQRQALFDKLQALRAENKKMLIVAYIHGWKHNANENDSNLIHFHGLLSQLTTIEKAAKRPHGARTVVGVYIGWRGASIAVPGVENLTFWTRKNAAERVGSRSIKQLFIELNQFRALANGWDRTDRLAASDETQLVFIGHSFGGLVTYTALYSALLERGLQINASGNYRTAKSFGDFILLVNPAFEGAAYEPIWQAALLRGCYPRQQKPVMAIITSSADNATRYAFPAGRLYTYFQSATLPGERETMMHTVGHLERYRTHRLEKASSGRAPTLPPPDTAHLASASQPNVQSVTSVGEFQLVRTDTTAPERMPYLVIQTGPELIADHNDFWNDRFRNFTVKFIASQILTPAGGHVHIDGESQGNDCSAFTTGTLEAKPEGPHSK